MYLLTKEIIPMIDDAFNKFGDSTHVLYRKEFYR